MIVILNNRNDYEHHMLEYMNVNFSTSINTEAVELDVFKGDFHLEGLALMFGKIQVGKLDGNIHVIPADDSRASTFVGFSILIVETNCYGAVLSIGINEELGALEVKWAGRNISLVKSRF